MEIKRKVTKVVRIGKVEIGGNNPIAIQSMVKSAAKNIPQTIAQIKALEKIGCSIIRVALKDKEDALALREIKNSINIPLVADIHFNWELAICAIKSGADKIRLNPGNLSDKQQIREIAALAKDYSIPIRVGLNSGSIPKALKGKSGLKPAGKLVEAALNYIKILEGFAFKDIVVSLKCSGILDTIEAYKKISSSCDYPLHLGLTAAGSIDSGKIKSALCIGNLLLEGIGDTIRVSLTASPQEEVKAAKDILSGLGLMNCGPRVLSCPTCGRTEGNLEVLVLELERRLSGLPHINKRNVPVKIAVMGCLVNGPGEAEDADLALIRGESGWVLYRNAKLVCKVDSDKAVDTLIDEYKQLCVK